MAAPDKTSTPVVPVERANSISGGLVTYGTVAPAGGANNTQIDAALTPVPVAEPTNEFLWCVSGSSICEPAGTIAENLPKEVAELIVNTHNQEIEAFCRAAAPPQVPRPAVAGGEAKPHFSWQRVYALLEQWRELWGGDKQQVTADHPEWIINAANELFAHDLCDEWNWNEYVGEASEIIARHFAASRTTRSAPAAPHLSGGVTGGFGGLSAADTTPSSAQLPSPEPTNFVSDTSLPSCHVCGEIMVGVCRKCGASTKPKWIPVNDGRGQTIGFTKAQVSKDK